MGEHFYDTNIMVYVNQSKREYWSDANKGGSFIKARYYGMIPGSNKEKEETVEVKTIKEELLKFLMDLLEDVDLDYEFTVLSPISDKEKYIKALKHAIKEEGMECKK